MKRGLLGRSALFPIFGAGLVIVSFFATIYPSLPQLAPTLLAVSLAFTSLAYFQLPAKRRKRLIKGVRKNAHYIALIVVIIILALNIIYIMPKLTAGTINPGTPTVVLQGGTALVTSTAVSVAISNVPKSSSGSAITCQAANDAAFTSGLLTCAACASGCSGGPYSCTIASFILSSCAAGKTVYSRCYDATSPAIYTSTGSDTISCDATASIPGAISSPAGGTYDSDGTYDVVWSGGSDSESGIASDTLYEQSAVLSDGVCGAYGGWTSISTTPGTTARNSLATGCYNYIVNTYNGAGTLSQSAQVAVKVDTTASIPGAISSPAGGTYDSDGTYDVIWSGGSDSESGIASDTLYEQSAVLSDGVCGAYGGWTSISTTPGTTARNSLATGCYNYIVNTYNGAGTLSQSAQVAVKVASPASTSTVVGQCASDFDCATGESCSPTYSRCYLSDFATTRPSVTHMIVGDKKTIVVSLNSPMGDTRKFDLAFSGPGKVFARFVGGESQISLILGNDTRSIPIVFLGGAVGQYAVCINAQDSVFTDVNNTHTNSKACTSFIVDSGAKGMFALTTPSLGLGWIAILALAAGAVLIIVDKRGDKLK